MDSVGIEQSKTWEQFQTDVNAVASALGIVVPKNTYRYAPYPCYKCGKKILVYAWPKGEMFSGSTPPENKPESIRLVNTKMSGETYWANTCHYCQAVQGDFFVNAEPDSPLFCLGGGVTDTAEAFEEDMQKIAEYYTTYRMDD